MSNHEAVLMRLEIFLMQGRRDDSIHSSVVVVVSLMDVKLRTWLQCQYKPTSQHSPPIGT